MANSYYARQGSYTKGTLARGDVVKSDFDALVTAWDSGEVNIKRALKLPNEGTPQTDWAITANAATRANNVIGFDANGDLELQTGVGAWEGTWTTSTDYQLRDVVVDGAAGANTDNLYICVVAHTSGTWSTDLAASKWELMLNVSEARDWARKTDGIVDSTDYSAKAWAIGGTDVTDTASRGAAKEWAIETSGTVDTTSYSAKEYAQGTQASTGGSAKDFAQKTDGGVSGDTSLHSAKAWAVGGTGVTDTASKGAAKDFAQKTDGGVSGDTSLHSAKAWAVGGTGVTDTASKGAAKEWATETSGTVDTSDYSAKEYAIGTQASTGGSAKDFAQKTDGGVSGATSLHSAKAWAVGGTGVTSTAGKGAAKEWAITAEDTTVDGTDYSALHWAAKSSASASAASTSESNAASSASAASTSASNASASASAASTSESNAATSETNAAASYDAFDDRYLGSKTSDPTLDNDGDALLDGATYWDTTNNCLKVYDTGTSTWYRTTPTSADQANINTVAGISADVTTVAGISANVTTVAGISSNVTTVATDITNVNTVAGSIADVNRYANEYTISSSAPVSPSEGDLWYDDVNNVLKFYDGATWQTIAADTDVLVGNSASDTTAGYLSAKIAAGSNVSLATLNSGGNEQLQINVTVADNSAAMALALGG